MSVRDEAKAIALEQLRIDEGLSLNAYPDPITRGAPWGIGYGHTGLGIFPGLRWNDAQAEAQLVADVEHACAGLDGAIPWWRTLDPVRASVLINMAFNLGVTGLMEFQNTLRAIKRGDWANASANVLLSKWATQTGDRAARLAQQLRTGKRS